MMMQMQQEIAARQGMPLTENQIGFGMVHGQNVGVIDYSSNDEEEEDGEHDNQATIVHKGK